MPNTHVMFYYYNFADDNEVDEEVDDLMRRHGILSKAEGIKIDLDHSKALVQETRDNTALMDNLRDQAVILNNKLLPMATKWTVVLTKAGENAEQDLLKKTIDLKAMLKDLARKASDLNCDTKARANDTNESSDDDDDDFIEVPDKDGYEEAASYDSVLDDPYVNPQPSTSGLQKAKDQSSSRSDSGLLSALAKLKHSEDLLSSVQSNKSQDDQASQETQGLLNALAKLKRSQEAHGHSSPDEGCSSGSSSPRKKKRKYDIDELAEKAAKESKPTKVLVDSERLRFWGASTADEEIVVPGSDSKIIEVEEEFEPVKWNCRAPLPSGRYV